MHNRFFANQNALNPDDLISHAEALGLDMVIFKECLDSRIQAANIRKDIGEATKVGVNLVPSFLIGYIEHSGKVRAVKMLKGAQPFASFKEEIDALATQKQK
jgi:predicted DsbA family dithiol-disulfide isomerase